MLLVQTRIGKFEGIIPNVWFGSGVMGWQLVLVAKVGIPDMLGQPVRGPVDIFSRHGGGHPGQSSEENIVLLLMGGCSATFSTEFKLTLFIVKMISEGVSVDIENIYTVRILSQLLQFVKEHLVFIIQAVIENKERLIPYIGIWYMEGHLALVFEVSVGDVL